jgi:hypothetical protein
MKLDHQRGSRLGLLGVGFRRVIDRGAGLGEDVAGHPAQRLPHRYARPQGGSVLHLGNI